MSCKVLDGLSGLQIPELHAVSCSQDHGLVVADLDLLDGLGIGVKLVHHRALSNVPFTDHTVLACREAAGAILVETKVVDLGCVRSRELMDHAAMGERVDRDMSIGVSKRKNWTAAAKR